MASPVDTSVKHYRSDMPGAPVVNGVAGSRIAQLEACLCTGYGLKSATSLVVAGGIATLSFAGGASAAWERSVILVAGVTGAMTDLNGEQKVTFADATTVKFATALADGTAAGTITFKIAPAGWEKVYSKTNVAVFRSLDARSSKMLLRVDDTSTTVSRVVGYETMTDVDTGYGAFPTSAQMSGGGYWNKSDTANSTPNAWFMASDGLFIIDSIAPGYWRGATYQNCATRGFGDPLVKNPAGDPYACFLAYSTTASPTDASTGVLEYNIVPLMAFARSYAGLGSCLLGCRRPYVGSTSVSGQESAMGAFPSVIDGGLILGRVFLTEATSGTPPRADVPGLLVCPQSGTHTYFKLFDTVVVGERTCVALRPIAGASTTESNASTGVSFVDVDGPWR